MWETSEELAWFYYVLKNNFWGPWFLYEPTYFLLYEATFPLAAPFNHRCGPSGAVIPGRWLALAHRHWRTSSTCSVSISGGKRGNCPQSSTDDFDPPEARARDSPVPGGYLRGQHARGVCWGGWKMVKIQGQLGFYPEFDVWVAKLNINHLRKVFIGHGNTSGNLVSFRF